MNTCNIFSGAGFGTKFMGPWSKALLGLALLFFILALAKKWLFESMDLPFNLIVGEVVGVIAYMVTANLSCSSPLALVIGLAAGAAGGYFGAGLFGGSD